MELASSSGSGAGPSGGVRTVVVDPADVAPTVPAAEEDEEPPLSPNTPAGPGESVPVLGEASPGAGDTLGVGTIFGHETDDKRIGRGLKFLDDTQSKSRDQLPVPSSKLPSVK